MDEQGENELVGCLLLVVLLVPLFILDGWVVMLLWRWFAAPLGAPPIGIAWAIGLTILARQLCPSPTGKDNTKISEAVVRAIGYPIFALALGFIVKSMM